MDVDWIHLAPDRDKMRAAVNRIFNPEDKGPAFLQTQTQCHIPEDQDTDMY